MSILRVKSLSVVNHFWAFPTLILIRLIRPLWLFRVVRIHTERIGHFVPDSVEFIYQQQHENRTRVTNLFFFGGISNEYWAQRVKEKLKIFPKTFRYLEFWNERIPGSHAHKLDAMQGSRDIYGHVTQLREKFSFSQKENKEAKKWLMERGWVDGEPFVTLLVRDRKYLSEKHPNADLSYHDYRDSDIATYEKGIEFLNKNNIWVIRMGKSAEKRISCRSQKIIDYAFDYTKSDFLDFWLFANSDACISTGAGADEIAAIHGVPQMYINFLPLIAIPTFRDVFAYPKILKDARTGVTLPLEEQLNDKLVSTDAFSKFGVLVQDLTAEEILSAFKEFLPRINGLPPEEIIENSRQERFWASFSTTPHYSEYHHYTHPNRRISQTWLNSQNDEFFQ